MTKPSTPWDINSLAPLARRRHHRQSGGQRLEHHQAARVVKRGQGKHIGAGKALPHVVDKTQELHTIA